MNSTGDSLATPLVRGTIAAAVSLGTAIALVVVPALAAQVAGTRSAATALDAIIISLNVLVLGHGGGIVLSTGVIDGPVTLTPFGLLGLLVLVSTLGMRRVGGALDLVRDDGVLRVRAIRDAGGALGAYAVVYAVGIAVIAAIGRSSDTSPMVTSAIVSGAMVSVVGGLLGILWSLRREPTTTVPGVRVLGLLPAPYGDVARAALIALSGMLGAGMLVVVVMMLFSIPAQASLFQTLDPGIVGGIVLTLVQFALLPLLAVWALVVVLGGTVGVGASTSLSLDGSETGVLPALPLLGAIPGPGEFPWVTWLLLVLPAIPVVLGAVRLVRDTRELEGRDRLVVWIAYPLTVMVAVMLLAGLATGGIGKGRLVHLGPQMESLLLPLLGVVVISTGVVLLALVSPLVPWSRAQIAALREKVESAERTERAGDRGPSDEASSGDRSPSDARGLSADRGSSRDRGASEDGGPSGARDSSDDSDDDASRPGPEDPPTPDDQDDGVDETDQVGQDDADAEGLNRPADR